MADLKSKRLIILKGALFLFMACLAATLLLLRHFDLTTSVLLIITVWASCRFYYFAFYVIQHYVDGDFRYTGLFDFALYCLGRKGKR